MATPEVYSWPNSWELEKKKGKKLQRKSLSKRGKKIHGIFLKCY